MASSPADPDDPRIPMIPEGSQVGAFTNWQFINTNSCVRPARSDEVSRGALASTGGQMTMRANRSTTVGLALAIASASVGCAGPPEETVGQTVAEAVTAYDNSAYVARVYRAYLSRTPDREGRYWITLLDAGADRAAVIRQIVTSPEGQGHVAEYDEVERCYTVLLQRPADAAGIQYWRSVQRAQGTVEVVVGFLTSDEFRYP